MNSFGPNEAGACPGDAGSGRGPRRPSALMAQGHVPDALIAEHGFSVLVTVTKAGREHRCSSC
jgi:hypothetical protein